MSNHFRAIIFSLTWVATGWIAGLIQAAEPLPGKPVPPLPADNRRLLDDAALARRIEEYSDTRTGEEREAEDQRARAVVKKFVVALVANDLRAMLAETSQPWVDRAELVLGEQASKRRIAEYRLPSAFAKGDPRITLINSLEELEKALGKKVPDDARKTWAGHLIAGSRIAVVEGGTMLLGFSVRRTKSEYSVSGLLFDYFPKPDDPLLQFVTKSPADRR